jgi:uncharacterized membrane-anchored protein YitT (DUF2179 family)
MEPKNSNINNESPHYESTAKKGKNFVVVFKTKAFTEIKRGLLTVFFTFLYGVGVVWFLEASPVPLYSGGVSGISQLIRDVVNIISGREVFNQFFLGIAVAVINIPIILLGYFGVSKRFAIYTLVSVIVQSTVLGFIPKIPLGDLSKDPLVLAVIGGAISGIGIGGSLSFGVSTGGFDVISQYLALKKGISVGVLITALNTAIALLGGLVMIIGKRGDEALQVVAYTIVRIIITDLVLDSIHKSYRIMKVEIISPEYENISKNIIEIVHRGVTLVASQGAFSKKNFYTCLVVVSGYELPLLKRIVKEIDPHAFVIVTKAQSVLGNFKKKTIM